MPTGKHILLIRQVRLYNKLNDLPGNKKATENVIAMFSVIIYVSIDSLFIVPIHPTFFGLFRVLVLPLFSTNRLLD